MNRYLIRLLMALNAALALFLVSLWFDQNGEMRNVHWQAPQPQLPDFEGMRPRSPADSAADITQFLALQERPLFSPTRRPPLPPPPPPPPVVPPPPDPLAGIHLYGLFSSAEGGGIIAKIEGKTRRVRIGETVGPWTLKALKDRDVTFARGEETRVLPLLYDRAAMARPAPPSGNAGGAAAAPSGAPGAPGAPGGPSAPPRSPFVIGGTVIPPAAKP